MKGARLTIGRTTSNIEDDYISIELLLPDRNIKLKLTLEEYALVISGQRCVPVKLERNMEKKA